MRSVPAFALTLALAATGFAQAQTPSQVPAATQKTLTGLYQTVCTAVQDPSDKNLDASFALLSPDFVMIDTKGKQHKRDEIVATMRMQLKQFEADDCTTTFGSITAPDASTLVVVETTHMTGSVQGQDATKHQLDATDTTSDTWKLVDGNWLQTQSKDLHGIVKVDGNVVQDTGN